MDDIRAILGRRVRYLRKAQGLSQETLAFLSGLDRTYVASIENGRRNVSIVNIERLANALGYSLFQFFNTKDFKEIREFHEEEDLAVAEKTKKKYR